MSSLTLEPGPAEVEHPRQWVPPPSQDGIPLEDRKEWLRDEPLTFLELFRRHVASDPGKTAVTWLSVTGKVERQFTYQELDVRSSAVSRKLREWGAKEGQCVVLVYPPGLDFLVSFIACLRTGIVAVPVYPPNPNDLARDLAKISKIVDDCGATLVLTTGRYLTVKRVNFMHRWPGKVWQTTDNIAGAPTDTPDQILDPDRLAFLQYTSGSTADPKGVMLSHTNIAHNIMFVRRTLRMHRNIRFFSWLPQYHDLGLIVAYLSTLSAGGEGFYMAPMDFIRSPPSWVQLMSSLKVTHTAAPNFALELTCRKFRPGNGTPLDLSNLECLLNAAEPVRAQSIAKWNLTFGPFGWHPSAMCPCYGLAEHVVGVSGWGSKVVQVGKGRLLHSSGHLATFPVDGRVVIVNSETLEECPEGVEGEIWARSRHVALGYWGKPELSEETFHGHMKPGAPGSDEGVYLRTGDLGFAIAQQLFITGRAKDLIIIRGRNYYPQDIEAAAEEAMPEIRPGCCAAFAVTTSELSALVGPTPSGTPQPAEEEGAAIVAELREVPAGVTAGRGGVLTAGSVKGRETLSQLAAGVSRAVRIAHGVAPVLVALIPPKTIPKTTSGKIRRKETKAHLLSRKLPVLNSIALVPAGATSTPTGPPPLQSGADLEAPTRTPLTEQAGAQVQAEAQAETAAVAEAEAVAEVEAAAETEAETEAVAEAEAKAETVEEAEAEAKTGPSDKPEPEGGTPQIENGVPEHIGGAAYGEEGQSEGKGSPPGAEIAVHGTASDGVPEPESGAPETEDGVPDLVGVPQAEASVPEIGVPAIGAPEIGVPGISVPEIGVPETEDGVQESVGVPMAIDTPQESPEALQGAGGAPQAGSGAPQANGGAPQANGSVAQAEGPNSGTREKESEETGAGSEGADSLARGADSLAQGPDSLAQKADSLTPPTAESVKAGCASKAQEDGDGPEKYDGMSLEDAVKAIMFLDPGLELQPEHTLVSLGLTSLDGMTVMELLAHRTGRILEPEEVEVLAIQHLRDVDGGGKLPDILIQEPVPEEDALDASSKDHPKL